MRPPRRRLYTLFSLPHFSGNAYLSPTTTALGALLHKHFRQDDDRCQMPPTGSAERASFRAIIRATILRSAEPHYLYHGCKGADSAKMPAIPAAARVDEEHLRPDIISRD